MRKRRNRRILESQKGQARNLQGWVGAFQEADDPVLGSENKSQQNRFNVTKQFAMVGQQLEQPPHTQPGSDFLSRVGGVLPSNQSFSSLMPCSSGGIESGWLKFQELFSLPFLHHFPFLQIPTTPGIFVSFPCNPSLVSMSTSFLLSVGKNGNRVGTNV